MGLTVRRTLGEAVGSAFCFVAVLVALVSIDDRVRDRMALLFSGSAATQVSSFGHRLNQVADALAQAVADQSIAHAPMLIFTMVAVVLVIFMLRT